MKTYEEVEYSNVSLQFDLHEIHRMVEELVLVGIPVSWKDTRRFFTLFAQTNGGHQRLHFVKHGKYYRLKNKNYSIKDQRFASILQKFILEMKGHAVLKYLTKDLLVVQNIRYGEPVRIIQIKGPQKKVLYEKECSITLDDVINAFNRTDAEMRIPVLRMELDYELARLYEAMESDDTAAITSSKAILEILHTEMLMLEM